MFFWFFLFFSFSQILFSAYTKGIQTCCQTAFLSYFLWPVWRWRKHTLKITGASDGGDRYKRHLVKTQGGVCAQYFAKVSISLFFFFFELMQFYIYIISWGMTLKLVFLGEYWSLDDCSYFWLPSSRQCWKGWCKIIPAGLMYPTL